MKVLIIFAFLTIFISQLNSSETNNDGNNHNGETDSDHKDPIEFILFFIIFGVIFGLILNFFSKITKIPYSPLVLILGILIGAFADSLWLFGDSKVYVIGLSSHTLLFVFIPPLIYEGAFSIDVRIFMKSIYQILILALPAVALGAFLIAVTLLYILRHNSELQWSQALTIGSILSATDPVAVVALLNELGTSVNFNMLLEGESLLNDGTGTVFFFVFLGWYEVGKFSVGVFFKKFFQLAFGGAAFGLAIGLITYPILKRIMKYENMFVIATVIIAYTTFFLSESAYFKIHVSGILSLVVLGLFYSYKLKGRVIGKVEEAMHFIWHFLAWIIETLLFFITGGFLGALFARHESLGLDIGLLKIDIIWKLVVFQFILLFLRFLILFICWPFLNMVGRKVSVKEIIVMSYAGLRGAIGLSLAIYIKQLSIDNVDQTDFDRFKVLTIVYTAATILFTVLFQGMTIKYLMKGIKFLKKNILTKRLKLIAREQLLTVTIKRIDQLKKEKRFSKTNWKIISKSFRIKKLLRKLFLNLYYHEEEYLWSKIDKMDYLIDCLQHLIDNKRKKQENEDEQQLLNTKQIESRKNSIYEEFKSMDESSNSDESKEIQGLRNLKLMPFRKSRLSVQYSQPHNQYEIKQKYLSQNIDNDNNKEIKIYSSLLCEFKARTYKMIQSLAYEKFEKQYCTYHTYKNIKYYCDVLNEKNQADFELNLYDSFIQERNTKKIRKLFQLLKNTPLLRRYISMKIFEFKRRDYDLATTLNDILSEIRLKKKHNLIFQSSKIKFEIMNDMDKEIFKFKDFIYQTFQENEIEVVQTRQVYYHLHSFQQRFIQKLKNKGELSENEKQQLNQEICNNYKVVQQHNNEILKKTQKQIKGKHSWEIFFIDKKNTTKEDLQKLNEQITVQNFKESQKIYDYDSEIEYVYIVKSGLIYVDTFYYDLNFSVAKGQILGLEHVYNNLKIITYAVTQKQSVLYKIPIKIFKEIAEKEPKIQKDCKLIEIFYYLKSLKYENNPHDFMHQLSRVKAFVLYEILQESLMKKFQPSEDQIFISNDALIVYQGQYLYINDSGQQIKSDKIIGFPPGAKLLRFLTPSTVFILKLKEILEQIISIKYIIYNIFFVSFIHLMFIYLKFFFYQIFQKSNYLNHLLIHQFIMQYFKTLFLFINHYFLLLMFQKILNYFFMKIIILHLLISIFDFINHFYYLPKEEQYLVHNKYQFLQSIFQYSQTIFNLLYHIQQQYQKHFYNKNQPFLQIFLNQQYPKFIK